MCQYFGPGVFVLSDIFLLLLSHICDVPCVPLSIHSNQCDYSLCHFSYCHSQYAYIVAVYCSSLCVYHRSFCRSLSHIVVCHYAYERTCVRHGLAILVGRWDRAASLCTWQRAVMDGWREREMVVRTC